jgi:hypothetical protein
MSKNLRYLDRAVTGSFIDPYIAKSVEYSLDREALRMIMGAGGLLAASQNGKM